MEQDQENDQQQDEGGNEQSWSEAVRAAVGGSWPKWLLAAAAVAATLLAAAYLLLPLGGVEADPLYELQGFGRRAAWVGLAAWVAAKLAIILYELLQAALEGLVAEAKKVADKAGKEPEKVEPNPCQTSLSTVAENATRAYAWLFAAKAFVWGFLLVYVNAVVKHGLTSGHLADILALAVAAATGSGLTIAVYYLAEPRKRDLAKIVGSTAFALLVGFVGFWVVGFAQARVESVNPAQGGDCWAFTVLSRDSRLTEGVNPPANTTTTAAPFVGWTLAPCSTRLTAVDGSPVYVVGGLELPKSKVFEGRQPLAFGTALTGLVEGEADKLELMVRLQKVADGRRTEPNGNGWVDQLTGEVLPWRFYIKLEGADRGRLVLLKDSRKAFGPNGEKVFDLACGYMKDHVAKVKQAYLAQTAGKPFSVKDLFGQDQFTWSGKGAEAPEGGIWNH